MVVQAPVMSIIKQLDQISIYTIYRLSKHLYASVASTKLSLHAANLLHTVFITALCKRILIGIANTRSDHGSVTVSQ